MNRDPTLCRSFVQHAKTVLSHFTQIKHTWSIDADEDHCILEIPKQCDGGFPITVEVFPDEVVVAAGDAHVHITPDGNLHEFVAHVLVYIRDLLSPTMRIREKVASGRAYKWMIEVQQCGRWETEDTTGIVFYNYFGKRSERIYQNSVLPSRNDSLSRSATAEKPINPIKAKHHGPHLFVHINEDGYPCVTTDDHELYDMIDDYLIEVCDLDFESWHLENWPRANQHTIVVYFGVTCEELWDCISKLDLDEIERVYKVNNS